MQQATATTRRALIAWGAGRGAITTGRNLATKALVYAVDQDAVMRILEDASLLDNTRSERALRNNRRRRTARMFHGSDTHAEAAVATFSFIASCRLRDLDTYR